MSVSNQQVDIGKSGNGPLFLALHSQSVNMCLDE